MKKIKDKFYSLKAKIVAHKMLSIIVATAVVVCGTGCGVIIAIATSGVKASSISIEYNENQKSIQAVQDPLNYENQAGTDNVNYSKEAVIPNNEDLSLTCKIEPENATFKKINWESSDTSIATVSTDGVVHALNKGEARITATNPNDNEELTDAIKVTVVNNIDDLKAIAQIRNDIAGLGDITLDSESAINSINEKYNNSNDNVKSELKAEIDAMNARLNELKNESMSNDSADTSGASTSNASSKTVSSKSSSKNKSGSSSSKSKSGSTGGSSGNSGGNSGGGASERTWWKDASLSNQVFALVNQYRQQNGVAPLAYNANCQVLSDKRALYNVTNQVGNHDYDQISFYGTTNAISMTASRIVESWKSSPGHNRCLLDSTSIGGAVSTYVDSNGHYYVVFTFDDGW